MKTHVFCSTFNSYTHTKYKYCNVRLDCNNNNNGISKRNFFFEIFFLTPPPKKKKKSFFFSIFSPFHGISKTKKISIFFYNGKSDLAAPPPLPPPFNGIFSNIFFKTFPYFQIAEYNSTVTLLPLSFERSIQLSTQALRQRRQYLYLTQQSQLILVQYIGTS